MGQLGALLGQRLVVEFAGGGGRGDPYRRPAARVREDVARGYVSVTGAREDYGVVLTPDLAVDTGATDEQRTQKIAP